MNPVISPDIGRSTSGRKETFKKAVILGIVLLSIAAMVTFFISAYSGRTDYTLRFISKVLVIISVVSILALGMYLYSKSRNSRFSTYRRFIVISASPEYIRADSTVVKAVDPSVELSFWRSSQDTTCSHPDDRICSVCLATVDLARPGALGAGQAACCNSWFHKYCVLQYWQSNDGNVICPNCRHDRSEMSS